VKKKRKARRAKLFQQRKNEKKINQIIQKMDQQEKKPIIIITIVRLFRKELILLSFDSLPCQTVKKFYHQISTVRKIKKYLDIPTYF
jgi:hypothetical protein